VLDREYSCSRWPRAVSGGREEPEGFAVCSFCELCAPESVPRMAHHCRFSRLARLKAY
jgi:hypothetical protein